MFVFKGISSEDMEVIAEEEKHFIAKARRRYNQNEIDGRNGAVFEELGYSVIDRPIKIQILNPLKMEQILAWLDGEGDFIYNNKITKARFYNEVEPIRTASIFIADCDFIRNPFWNRAYENFVNCTEGIIINEGTVYSEPIIRLEKIESEYIDFTINDIRIVYNFNEDTYVEINSEEKTVEYDSMNRNRQIEMGYEFPILNPGNNKITINSGNAVIKFKRKDRWL